MNFISERIVASLMQIELPGENMIMGWNKFTCEQSFLDVIKVWS